MSGGLQKTPERAPKHNARPYLTVRNVRRDALDLSHVEHFEVSNSELLRYKLRHGDILVVEGNGSVEHIGRSAVFDLEGEWIHQNHVIRVRADPSFLDCRFLNAYLGSPAGRDQLMEKARTTSGLFTLSVSKIEALDVPLPPVDIQAVVVAQIANSSTAMLTIAGSIDDQLRGLSALPARFLAHAFEAC